MRRPARLLPLALIALVLLGAFFLRTWRFADWPPGFSHDEAVDALDSWRLARTGGMPLYLPDERPETLFRFFVAGTILLVGPSPFAARLTSLFLGMIAVAAAHRAGRHLAWPGYQRQTALVAASALAVMVGHVQISRVAYRASVLVPAVLLFFDSFCVAWRHFRQRDFVLAAVFLMAIVQGYTSGLAVLPAAFLALIHRGAGELRTAAGRFWRGTLTFLLAFAIAIIPHVVMVIIQPGLYIHAQSVGRFQPDKIINVPMQLLAAVWHTLPSFYLRGDINPQYNVAQAPLLHTAPLVALAATGVVACLLAFRRLPHALALGLVIFLMLPVGLSIEYPHGLRISGEYAAVPLVIAAGVGGLIVIWRKLADRIPRRRWIAAGLGAGLAALFLGAGVRSGQIYADYFQSDVRWYGYSAFAWFFETPRQRAAQYIAEQDGPVYIPLSEIAHPSMRLFTAASHPRVTTFAIAFPGDGPLELPAGQWIIPPVSYSREDFVLLLPEGTIVLLPRLDEDTLRALDEAIRAGLRGGTLVDAYGASAGVVAHFPPDGSSFRLERPIQHAADLDFGGQVRLVGWAGPEALSPQGGGVSLTLYFSPGPAVGRDPLAFAQLWGLDHAGLASGAAAPVYRWLYPPIEWRAGDVVPVLAGFNAPPGLAPGAYLAAVGVQDWRGRFIPVLGADGLPAADMGIAGRLKAPREAVALPADMIPVNAQFGGEIALRGYTMSNPGGGPISVTLYWQALQRPSADYTVFVHLVDLAGNLIAQSDLQPDDGRYPTGIWDAGEIVPTTHMLAVSGPLPEAFIVYAGMYTWPDLLRLPAVLDARPQEDNRVLLFRFP